MIYDHAPTPGPLQWDWRCTTCGKPCREHAGLVRRLLRRLDPNHELAASLEPPEAWEPPPSWTCWRCTHPLCPRLAQSWEIDYCRMLVRNETGPKREELYRRLQVASLEVTERELDPPKCIGSQTSAGGYYSHRATPMELVEVAVIDGSKYVPEQPTDQGGP